MNNLIDLIPEQHYFLILIGIRCIIFLFMNNLTPGHYASIALLILSNFVTELRIPILIIVLCFNHIHLMTIIADIFKSQKIPKPTIYVDEDEICSICQDPIEDTFTYYRPSCGHLHCFVCMDSLSLLSKCSRCNEPFMIVTPVRVLLKNQTITID